MPSRTEIIERYRAAGLDTQANVVAAFNGSYDYMVRDLTDDIPRSPREFRNTQIATPLHWFGLYPAEGTTPGVRAIQFGIGTPAIARASQEVIMEVTARNGADVTIQPYLAFGGDMVRQVRAEGHTVFSALEVNTIEINDDELLLFTRLALSKGLLDGRDMFSKVSKNKTVAQMRDWEQKIANSRFSESWKVAEMMAWSAFATAGVSEARPVYDKNDK